MASVGYARVVNSAFLNELKECNSNLWDDVNLLGSYAQEPFCADWIEQNGGALLHRLRECLSAQFRLEETFGYVAGPTSHQDANVTKALDQHLSIVLVCVALSERFDDLEYSGKLSNQTLDIWRQLKDLHEAIMNHEALERTLCSAAWAPVVSNSGASPELILGDS